jgi:hypothetical protein
LFGSAALAVEATEAMSSAAAPASAIDRRMAIPPRGYRTRGLCSNALG